MNEVENRVSIIGAFYQEITPAIRYEMTAAGKKVLAKWNILASSFVDSPRWRNGDAIACRAIPIRFDSGPWLFYIPSSEENDLMGDHMLQLVDELRQGDIWKQDRNSQVLHRYDFHTNDDGI